MYGVAAIGLSVIFGTMRIIFLAQGSMIVLFAYLTYWLFTAWRTSTRTSPWSSSSRWRSSSAWASYYAALQEGIRARRQERLPAARRRSHVPARQSSCSRRSAPIRGTSRPPTGTSPSTRCHQHRFVRLVALVIAIAATIAVFWFLKRTLLGTASPCGLRGHGGDASAGHQLLLRRRHQLRDRHRPGRHRRCRRGVGLLVRLRAPASSSPSRRSWSSPSAASVTCGAR